MVPSGRKIVDSETIEVVDVVADWTPTKNEIMKEIIGIEIMDDNEILLISAWMHDSLDLDLVNESRPPPDEVKANMRKIHIACAG